MYKIKKFPLVEQSVLPSGSSSTLKHKYIKNFSQLKGSANPCTIPLSNIFVKKYKNYQISICRFSDYGTMLEIRDIQYFEDGRSVVDTIGGKRFKVLSRGVKDGYNTAKVEYLHDEVLEGEDLESKYWQLFFVQIDFSGTN